MEVKTKEDWLYQFRRCSSRETLEKVITRTRYKPLRSWKPSAVDRLAELTTNFTRVEPVWSPEYPVMTTVWCYLLCVILFRSSPVVGNLDNTANVKRYCDNE